MAKFKDMAEGSNILLIYTYNINVVKLVLLRDKKLIVNINISQAFSNIIQQYNMVISHKVKH